MKTYLIFYTDIKFRSRENELISHYSDLGFSNIIPYRSEFVKTGNFYKNYKEILDCLRGDGYWLWKPKIILDTFDKMEYGDVLLYTDAGDVLGVKESDILSFSQDKDYCFTNWGGRGHLHRLFTKRDCFIMMECDTHEYHSSAIMEAGFLVLKKTKENIDLINEWFHYCSIKQIISDDPNIYGNNLDGWIEHRWDQSILTNLILKKKLKFDSTFDEKINCNVYLPNL